MASSLYKARAGDELAKLKEAVSELEGDKGDKGTELSEQNKKIIGIE